MKCKTVLVTSIAIMLVVTLISYAHAHSGKTDFKGGHYDRSSGGYHFHHGYSAHQHYDGECPYKLDDKTNHNSGSSNSDSTNSSSTNHGSNSNNSSINNIKHTEDTLTFGDIIIKALLFFPFLFLSFCILSIFNPLVNGTINISNERASNILYIVHITLCIIVAIVMTIFIE